jgi:hypothetical protein
MSRKQAEAKQAEELKKQEKAKQATTCYVIADGKAITTPKGIKSNGDKVDVSFFASKEIFDNLVKKKFIVKK